MATLSERKPWNALKFRTTGEVNSKEGGLHAQWLEVAPPKHREVGAPQGELNRAVGENLILYYYHQCLRTKLIFDVRINDPFMD